MAVNTYGPFLPTGYANDSSNGGDEAWEDLDALLNDARDERSTSGGFSAGDKSHRAIVKGFPFGAVQAGGEVQQIRVTIDPGEEQNAARIIDGEIKLVKAGVIQTDDQKKTYTPPASVTTVDWDKSDPPREYVFDVSGWSGCDLNHPESGVAIVALCDNGSAQAQDAELAVVTMTADVDEV